MKFPPRVVDRLAGGSMTRRLKGPFLSPGQGNIVNKYVITIEKKLAVLTPFGFQLHL